MSLRSASNWSAIFLSSSCAVVYSFMLGMMSPLLKWANFWAIRLMGSMSRAINNVFFIFFLIVMIVIAYSLVH